LGTITKSKAIHIGYTATAIFVTLFAAVNMNNYEIINYILE